MANVRDDDEETLDFADEAEWLDEGCELDCDEECDPEARALLERIDALSEDDVRLVLAFLAGYQPEIVEEQVARREAQRVQIQVLRDSA